MTKYITRTAYFETLAIKDPLIKHTANVSVEGESQVRNSFIQISADQDGLNSDMISGLHWPFVIQSGFTGSVTERNFDIRNQYQNRLQFLTKVVITDAIPTKAQAIKNAKEQCLFILKKWLNRIYSDIEKGCAGDIRKIELSSVIFYDLGPISDDFYGWQLSFADDEPANDVIDADDEYFNP